MSTARPERRGRGKRTRPDEMSANRAPPAHTLLPTISAAQSFSPYPQQGSVHSLYAPSPSGPLSSTVGQHGTYRELLGVSTEPPPGKVAIPPLRSANVGDASSKDRKKGRTSHACETCRRAKAGCTGGQPCLRCRNTCVPCIYGDGKRDKERKIMTQLSKETEILNQHKLNVAEALRRIVLDTSLSREGLVAAVDAVLTQDPDESWSGKSAYHKPSMSQPSSEQDRDDKESGGEYDVDADVGSVESLDAVHLDADEECARGTGHLGKSSAVVWAGRTTEEFQQSIRGGSAHGPPLPSLTSMSYLTEDADLAFVDTSSVNAFDWPDDRHADELLQTYFDQVHDAFPVLEREVFISKYESFVRGSNDVSPNDRVWLAQLNAIFAIAAVRLHVTDSVHRGHHYDHHFYCARARMLGAGGDVLYEDARVDTTCTLALISLYYFTTCRLNRAFTICGLAVRNAITLGLHMRNLVEELPDSSKEHRVRLWWSLYTLECSLAQFTGRPTCLSQRDISTPLPINLDERKFDPRQALYEVGNEKHGRPSNRTEPASVFTELSQPLSPSTHFVLHVQLSIITHEILAELYCPAVSTEKWGDIESIIRRIDDRLMRWRDGLPKEFEIGQEPLAKPDKNDPWFLHRSGLSMLFNGARMVLYRPCLCRFEGRIPNQSEKSKNFTKGAAQICIGAAREIINTLSWNATDLEEMYAITPWWNILHHLCGALSVLMLEMAYQSTYLPDQAAYILADATKGIGWLAMMAKQSISARKAWEIYDGLVRLAAPRMKYSAAGLPTEAFIPPGHNWKRFQNNNPSLSSQHLHMQQESSLPSFPSTSRGMAFPMAADSMAWSAPPTAYPEPSSDYPYSQLVANPLDHAAALQRFSGMAHLHSYVDDPWQHLFNVSRSVQEMGMVAPEPMDVQLTTGSEGMRSAAAQASYYPSSDYPIAEGHYEHEHGQSGFGGSQYGDLERRREE